MTDGQPLERPLDGVVVVEMAGIGPTQLAGVLFADLGADVIRIERNNANVDPAVHVLNRGRRSVAVDLKAPGGRDIVLRLVGAGDVLVEGYRPGVMERLGLGPADCHAQNPKLVYARATGWGQDGPLALRAGHDINYLALAGVLNNIRRAGERPVPPLNLIADFGGGGMLLAVGVLSGLFQAQRSGRGPVIDCSMLDGSALLLMAQYSMMAQGTWIDDPGHNIIDTGAPFYEVYETSDGRFMAVGAIEPAFYTALLEGLGLAEDDLPPQMDDSGWPELKRRFAAIFATRAQQEWVDTFSGVDACVTPVLSLTEAPLHESNRLRETFVQDARGTVQPGPAPRFDGRRLPLPGLPPAPGEHTDSVLTSIGCTAEEIADWRRGGALS